MLKRQSTRNNRSGALTVEMALCMPILFIFLFGCYEVAHANMILHTTESAAYEAARRGIVPGADQDQMRQAARGILGSVGIKDFEITIIPSVITPATPNVRVEISVDHAKNSAALKFFMKDMVFRGRCELSRETMF